MHPWPVLLVVRGGESRGAPCLGRELFAGNGGGRCHRKCPTPRLYNGRPMAIHVGINQCSELVRRPVHTFKVDDMTSSE